MLNEGNAVLFATFSPNGTRIVTASDDKTARVWDATTGNVIAILRGHQDLVRSAAFSPDGSRIVTASDDTTARIWDAGTMKLAVVLKGHTAKVIGLPSAPMGPALSRRRMMGRRVFGTPRRAGKCWFCECPILLENVYSATFGPDGQRILYGKRLSRYPLGRHDRQTDHGPAWRG